MISPRMNYIDLSQSGRCNPLGALHRYQRAVTQKWAVGGAVTQKWAVEGQQFSSCSCCHEGRITGGIPGQFSFTNP